MNKHFASINECTNGYTIQFGDNKGTFIARNQEEVVTLIIDIGFGVQISKARVLREAIETLYPKEQKE